MRQLEITLPDDWHLHLRDGAAMADVLVHTANQFGRAIIMPNLTPPVVTGADAIAYRERILAALPESSTFQPLMTLYLTDGTTPDVLATAKASAAVSACKLYPAGATTNSAAGVTDLSGLDDLFAAMAELHLPLLIHGEVTDPETDIFERESEFVRSTLPEIIGRHPDLKIVLEHITTEFAAQFVAEGPDNLAATITAHHLLVNRNAMLAGGIRPHLYCLPILKRENDRRALVKAAISKSPKFFLGTDSAPHAIGAKENPCGCAGCFTAHAALELYAEAFDGAGALDALEGFASFYGPDFYGLPRNRGRVLLSEGRYPVPAAYDFGGESVRPFRANDFLNWRATKY